MNNAVRQHPGRILLAVLAVALVLLILLWDWNWFRPLVARQASAALNRPVTLRHFDVELGRHPRLIAEGIALANPEEFPADSGPMATVDKLAIRVDPWAWFDGRLSLLEIEIDKPVGDLRPGPSGKANYVFDLPQDEKKKDDKPLRIDIGRLAIREGDVHIVEPTFKADFRLRIRTLDDSDGEPRIRVDADGRYADAPIEGRFIGGSVLALRDAAKPYPVDLRARNGDTEVSLQGSVIDPIRLGGARLRLDFKGANLADLFPLTGVPLPPSPPYRIGGQFDYEGGQFRFRNFSGVYGQSDIAGNLAVDPAGEARRRISLDAHSDKVVWSDLSGFIGATPGDKDAPTETPEQKREREKKKASGKLLPDTPIALPRIRAADLDVRYRVARIESEITPIDKLEAHLKTEDGLITVRPLKLGVGEGSIAANIELDGRKEVVHTVADIDFRKLDFSKIVDKLSVFRGSGTVGGSARLDAQGNSLAAMLGNGNGDLKLFMAGGDISALLVNLAGLDFGNSLISALGLPRRADLRCMVVDMGLEGGRVDTRMLLLDTTEANIIGKGDIDLKQERIDYKIHTEPKRLNVASLAAPIDIEGPLAAPHVRPQVGKLAVRGGTAALLGVLFTPLAALIPTIQLGLGEDNNCMALLQQLQQVSAPPANAKPK